MLYTRAPDAPKAILPRVAVACDRAGIDFGQFVFTDNTCKVRAAERNRWDVLIELGRYMIVATIGARACEGGGSPT